MAGPTGLYTLERALNLVGRSTNPNKTYTPPPPSGDFKNYYIGETATAPVNATPTYKQAPQPSGYQFNGGINFFTAPPPPQQSIGSYANPFAAAPPPGGYQNSYTQPTPAPTGSYLDNFIKTPTGIGGIFQQPIAPPQIGSIAPNRTYMPAFTTDNAGAATPGGIHSPSGLFSDDILAGYLAGHYGITNYNMRF